MSDDQTSLLKDGKQMIDSLPAAIYTTDPEGRLTHFNPAAVEFSGREPELGTDQWCVTWKLYYPDGRPMAHDECPMALSLKEQRSIKGAEAIAERPDGERIWFRAYPSPLWNERGEMIGGINMLIDITGEKRDEEERRRQEQELNDFFENATIGLHWVRSDGIIKKVNHAELEMLGYSRDEYVGRHIENFHADQEVIDTILQKLSAGEELQDYEARLRCKDGSIRHVLISSNVYRRDGKFIHTRCITRDITRRKETEEALRKSEEKYRTLFETMEEGFCILQLEFDEHDRAVDFRYLETNSAFEKHTGLKDMEGKSVREALPDLESHWFDTYGRVALTGEPERFENYSEELDRWFELSAFRIGEPQERKVAVLFNNVTEQKRIRENRKNLLREVQNERERLSEIFQHAPSFMCVMRGPDHVFERANEYYMQLVGEEKDIIGRPAREVFPEIEGQGFFELLDDVYTSGEPYVGTDVPVAILREKDAPPETRYIDLVYQPLRDSDGTISGIFAQGVDLTERRKAKEELHALNETLEERVKNRTSALLSYQDQLRTLASRLSKAEEFERHRLAAELHDNLGQMLAVGKMKADLLHRNHQSDGVKNDISALKEVIEEALTYTRNLMTELKPPPSLDNGDLLAKIEWVARKMEKHDLKVDIQDDGRPKPLSEELQTTLIQCVRELLYNVVKHTGVDEARVTLARDDRQIQVVVADEGCGFDPEQVSAPSEKGGFGLFNIQERIDMVGGRMNIESGPGSGTRASLAVPLDASDATEKVRRELPARPETPAYNGTPDTIRIVLADDHQMVREGLRKIIEEEEDMTVIGEAADGEEAVALSLKTSPDIILMDVNMPKMDGIEATRMITGKLPGVRVIGLSLHDGEGVIRDMRSVGATAYLTKNEAFESLVSTIRAEASAPRES